MKLEKLIEDKCKAENCENKLHAKGYCQRHYAQIAQYGKILPRTIHDPNEIIIDEDIGCAVIFLYDIHKNIVGHSKIDLEDVPKVEDYKWMYDKSTGYARSCSANGQKQYLHRFLLNPLDTQIIDHINRDKLDNRKQNIRITNRKKNAINSSIQSNNTSGVIGVGWSKSMNKWRARLNLNKKEIFTEYFSDFDDAVEARLKAEIKYFKDFSPQKHLFKQYGISGGEDIE